MQPQEKPLLAVILAAGKGTRMLSAEPKANLLLDGKPLLIHVMEHLRQASCVHFIIVVGHQQAKVRRLVEASDFPSYEFVVQAEQLGTGHALLCAKEALASYQDQGPFIVSSADMPLLSASTFRALWNFHESFQESFQEGFHKSPSKGSHEKLAPAVTVLSAFVEDAQGYGRIVKAEAEPNQEAELLAIVEERDATSQEKCIQEVNTGTYVCNAPQVFTYLAELSDANQQKEYYLTDIIAVARRHRALSYGFCLEPSRCYEAQGVNDPGQLQKATQMIRENLSNYVL